MLGPAFAIRRRSRSSALQKLATILACAELVADKLPGIPRRTAALPLIGRALSGAAVATALRPRPGRAWVAAFLGATVAVTAALAGLRARSALDRALGGRAIHNAVGGAIEDLAVLAIGTALARRA
jgi:uncharacterized membrane protein